MVYRRLNLSKKEKKERKLWTVNLSTKQMNPILIIYFKLLEKLKSLTHIPQTTLSSRFLLGEKKHSKVYEATVVGLFGPTEAVHLLPKTVTIDNLFHRFSCPITDTTKHSSTDSILFSFPLSFSDDTWGPWVLLAITATRSWTKLETTDNSGMVGLKAAFLETTWRHCNGSLLNHMSFSDVTVTLLIFIISYMGEC